VYASLDCALLSSASAPQASPCQPDRDFQTLGCQCRPSVRRAACRQPASAAFTRSSSSPVSCHTTRAGAQPFASVLPHSPVAEHSFWLRAEAAARNARSGGGRLAGGEQQRGFLGARKDNPARLGAGLDAAGRKAGASVAAALVRPRSVLWPVHQGGPGALAAAAGARPVPGTAGALAPPSVSPRCNACGRGGGGARRRACTPAAQARRQRRTPVAPVRLLACALLFLLGNCRTQVCNAALRRPTLAPGALSARARAGRRAARRAARASPGTTARWSAACARTRARARATAPATTAAPAPARCAAACAGGSVRPAACRAAEAAGGLPGRGGGLGMQARPCVLLLAT